MNQEREKSVHSQEVVTLTTKQADTWVVWIVYVQTRSNTKHGHKCTVGWSSSPIVSTNYKLSGN